MIKLQTCDHSMVLGFLLLLLASNFNPAWTAPPEAGQDSPMEMTCIEDYKVYCKDKTNGHRFNDGCNICRCIRHDGVCPSGKCRFQVNASQAETYCPTVMKKNRERFYNRGRGRKADFISRNFSAKRNNASPVGNKAREKLAKKKIQIRQLKKSLVAMHERETKQKRRVVKKLQKKINKILAPIKPAGGRHASNKFRITRLIHSVKNNFKLIDRTKEKLGKLEKKTKSQMEKKTFERLQKQLAFLKKKNAALKMFVKRIVKRELMAIKLDKETGSRFAENPGMRKEIDKAARALQHVQKRVRWIGYGYKMRRNSARRAASTSQLCTALVSVAMIAATLLLHA